MGHTKSEDLKDLQSDFEELRTLEGIKEKRPGIFYYKAIPFLHFHDEGGKRWADVKTPKGWLKLDIDFGATKKSRSEFLKNVLNEYKRFARK